VYDKWLATVWHAPLFELGVDDSVGEALAADSDALKYTVALQLVQDQFGVHHTWQHHHTLPTSSPMFSSRSAASPRSLPGFNCSLCDKICSFTRNQRASSLSEKNESALTDHASHENHVINWPASTILDGESDKSTTL